MKAGMRTLAVAVALGGAAGAAASQAAGEKRRPLVEHYTSPATTSLKLPFSEAVRVGNLLFLSGQLGLAPGTRTLAPGGVVPETRQTLENIRRIAEAHGSSMDRLVKCTVFLADMAEWPRMNEVYVTFFPRALPARSAMGASGLALGARVEIECIGAVD